MKSFTLCSLFFFVSFPASFAQTLVKDWGNCYSDATANYVTNDMATDKFGNTYMTGYFIRHGDEYYNTSMFVLKTNKEGALEWMEYYSNDRDSIDNGKSLAIDNAGNIYVTGTRIDTFCNICTYNSTISYVFTIKFNSAGEKLWINRYQPGEYNIASPAHINTSSNGYSCVTSNQVWYNPQTFRKENTMVLQTIAPNGRTIWVKKYKYAIGNSSCIDNNLNIAVAAAWDFDNTYNYRKPMLIKYNYKGNLMWMKTIDEYNKNGAFFYVYSDSEGNIYANGQTDTIAFYNRPRIITAKYKADGSQLWARKEEYNTYTLPGFHGGFYVDKTGNSYVTGYIKVTDYQRKWNTTKYNSAGSKIFTNIFSGNFLGNEFPVDIKTNNQGNIFVAGSVIKNSQGNNTFALVEYSSTGTQLSASIFNYPNSTIIPIGVDFDAAGNIYEAGSLCTVKYLAPTGNLKMSFNNLLTISPNPAQMFITLKPVEKWMPGNYKLIISSNTGEILLQKDVKIVPAQNTIQVDVKNLKGGMYVVKLSGNAAVYSEKFIKN